MNAGCILAIQGEAFHMKRTSILVTGISLMLVGLLAVVVYYFIRTTPVSAPSVAITSFETCVAAGNPIMESFPRQCRDAVGGTTYTEQGAQNPTTATRTFPSAKGISIELDDWPTNSVITSPLTIHGRVPGNWSFEASFPVVLKDSAGNIIAQAPAALQGDWMTNDMVAFSVTLEFTKPANKPAGTLIFQKANPSDLVQNADSLQLSVQFK
jgi:hypothetical protein